MPFKLRLKRSRQYNVVSKSLFVITIELLDGSNIECTLSGESSGQECLDSVCQRLGLHQPEFFGLRYTWRHGGPGPAPLRWVELERPLKRQLDKNARGNVLLLCVMYYVSGVHLIHDEMTRYHYFLQLKTDLIEGRMQCDHKQAILLASYGMQAEFGNHDSERHTAEYLKDFNMFPKHLTDRNRSHLESMVDAVIRQHAALAGLAQGTAEEFYILAAQQLEGYGQEIFTAKDESGLEVTVGVSLNGILAAYESSSKFFKWKDITNVINHKRHFGIECQSAFDNMQFVFSDPELAKYVWRMCVHQHTFYMQNENAVDNSVQNVVDQNQAIAFRSAEDGQLCESREELDTREIVDWNVSCNTVQRALSTSCLDLSKSSEMDRLRALLPSYRPAPDYETAVQLKYHNNNAPNSNTGVLTPCRMYGTYLYSSQPDIHRTQTQLLEVQKTLAPFAIYKDFPDVAADVKLQMVLPSSVHSPGAAYSTSDLDAVDSGMHLLHLYSSPPCRTPCATNHNPSSMPPPPYPVLRGASSSTPDLATQAVGLGIRTSVTPAAAAAVTGSGRQMHHGPLHVSGSSPDLVSSRGSVGGRIPLGLPPPLTLNAAAHRTYTDLVTAAASTIESPVFSAPEPIYENVPLPWATATSTASATPSSTTIPLAIRPPSLQSSESPEAPALLQSSFATLVSSSASNRMSGGHTPPYALTIPLAEHHQASLLTQNPTHTQVKQTQQLQQMQQQHHQQQMHHQQQQPLQQRQLSQKYQHQPVHQAQQGSKAALAHLSFTVDQEAPEIANTSVDGGGKGKTKRKWVLLGGKSKGKSNTLGKEKPSSSTSVNSSITDADVSNRQHRWSTGLPRVPLSPTVSKENMCRVLERKLADSQLFFEFEKIPKKKPNADFSTALHPENEKRNRYKDVLPYEENRVRLIPSRENKFGYINASHITATVGSHQRFYIAAQGPLPNTVHSFWQMIWEADVYLVVMLCGVHDDGIASYCPSNGERALELGDFQVWRQFSQETGHCITTKLRLYHSTLRRMRGIWHLQYIDWGEQGCPLSVGHFLGFLEELSSVREHTVSEIPPGHNRNPPVLVHCSAGVGRTGVAILNDLLLFTLDHNQEIDIPRVTALLRQQRMLMVQTVAQYRFVHTLLMYYLKHSRLI